VGIEGNLAPPWKLNYGRKDKSRSSALLSTRSPRECGKPLQMNRCDLGNSMLQFLSKMYRPFVLQLFL